MKTLNQILKVHPNFEVLTPITIEQQEEMKANRRLIDRAARKIERERGKIELAEKKQMKEIQKLAKMGQHVS